MKKTINSVKIWEAVNEFRAEEGCRSQLRYFHFLSKIRRDESILSNLGVKLVDEVKDSEGVFRKTYEFNKDSVKYLLDMTTNSDRVPLQKIYEELGGQYSKLYYINRNEDEFMKNLSDTLYELGLDLIREYKILNYLVDGYIKDVNLVIEYDEDYHSSKPQKAIDRQRENEIIKSMRCDIIRLDCNDTDSKNIGKVIRKIMEIIDEGWVRNDKNN